MSGRPKDNIMTPAEMQEVHSRSGRLYSRTADGGEVVSTLIGQLADELANMPKKIDLRDEELIKEVTVAYVHSCSLNGIIPNKSGWCRSAGISRRAVDYFLQHHAEEPSAELLRIIFDSFAEMLNNCALTSACHPIVSIFLSKAIYGYRDTVSIETEQRLEDPLGKQQDIEDILAKYKDLDLLPD